MGEHSIRLWCRFDGSFDVTHHANNGEGNLYDIDKDFRNFKTIEEAVEYMNRLKLQIVKRQGIVSTFGFETFGYQTKEGNWSAAPENSRQPARQVLALLFKQEEVEV